MEFRDLKKQYLVLKSNIDNQIANVLNNAHFISGPEVKELEKQLAKYVGVKHCITCGNGTDAITLALMAWNIGKGDAVFVPDFTFFSTGECPAFEGATPIFVDVDKDTYNMDINKLVEAIEKVKNAGRYVPKVIIAVDLFGQPADYVNIIKICKKYNLFLLEDGAQGFGGRIGKQKACSFGDISTTSFFPAKPLGCYGDGGAVFTNNDEWAAYIRSVAVHGKNKDDKYDNIRLGMNSRLDTIQAAILLSKFDAFVGFELDDINKVARWYSEKLEKTNISLPVVKEGVYSSWAQYTIKFPDKRKRNQVQDELKKRGIPTMVYYMKPMHAQTAFEGTISAEVNNQVTEMLCNTVLSLPIHPYMDEKMVDEVVDNILDIMREKN